MTIGEIAEKTNLPESTLRYYEKKGLIKVARDGNGHAAEGYRTVFQTALSRQKYNAGTPGDIAGA